jgi:hypothetical protein
LSPDVLEQGTAKNLLVLNVRTELEEGDSVPDVTVWHARVAWPSLTFIVSCKHNSQSKTKPAPG